MIFMNNANISSKRFPVTLISWRAGAMNTVIRDAIKCSERGLDSTYCRALAIDPETETSLCWKNAKVELA